MISARELDKSEYPLWDQLIATSPHGKTFLRSEWLTMLTETEPGYRTCLLGCFDEHNRLVGGQALGYTEHWDMKIANGYEFLYSGPVLTPWADKASASQSAKTYTALTAIAQALKERFAYVSLETQPSMTDIRAFIYEGWTVTPVYSHIWRLHDIDRAWANMNHGKRNRVRHAQQKYTFDIEDSTAAVKAFAGLYRDTMAKFHWLPSLSWEATLVERFRWMHERDGARLFTARDQTGKIVGALAVILSRDDKTGLLWRIGTSKDFVEQGGAPALYWHAVQSVASEYPNVDFGWSPQASLSQFKDFMGADLELHFRVTRCNNRSRYGLYTNAMSMKDRLYNALAPVVYEPWQKLRYGRQYQRTLEQSQ